MKTDKGQFDEVLRRMLKKEPQKTTDIRAPKKEPVPPNQRSRSKWREAAESTQLSR